MRKINLCSRYFNFSPALARGEVWLAAVASFGRYDHSRWLPFYISFALFSFQGPSAVFATGIVLYHFVAVCVKGNLWFTAGSIDSAAYHYCPELVTFTAVLAATFVMLSFQRLYDNR